MNRHKLTWNRCTLILLTACLFAVILMNCSEETGVKRYKNNPPRVWISSGPPEGSLTHYEIKFSWGGWDPDGKVEYFEYAITDNEGAFDPADTTFTGAWTKTTKTEDTFIFSADQPVDSIPDSAVEEFQRSHTFFIRAVDDGGLASREPAYLSFTARTLSPRISVTLPPKTKVALVPGLSTYRWTAVDYVDDLQTTQDPESVSWILESTQNHYNSYDQTLKYIRSLPVTDPKWDEWGGWVWYGAPLDGGKFWATPSIADGRYVFAIRAKDEAGAITPVFDKSQNVRYVRVAQLNTGPKLNVRYPDGGLLSTVLCNEPLKNLEWPAGVPAQFCWNASADYYGGTVAGYRFGWDVANLENPDDWDVDYTPFTSTEACSSPRTIMSGSHVFTVEVIDANGVCSRVEVLVHFIQFTMNKSLLVVDDFAESTSIGWDDPRTPGRQPSDEQHDLFWEDMVEDVAGFNPAMDVIQVTKDYDLSLTDLSDYKSIVWSVDFDDGRGAAALPEFVRYFPKDGTGGARDKPNVIAMYMAAGGHVLICGHQPVSAVINPYFFFALGPRFPLILESELTGHGSIVPSETPGDCKDSFAYRELCLETLDFAFKDASRRRSLTIGIIECPDPNPRQIYEYGRRDHTMRAAIPIDIFAFPRLDLIPETAGYGRWYNQNIQGLDAEVYNPEYFLSYCPTAQPPRACFEPIYGVEMLDTEGENFGAPVAFWTSTHADKIANAPGAVPARSAVFGFPPVYFRPFTAKAAIEVILFEEWQLPRK